MIGDEAGLGSVKEAAVASSRSGSRLDGHGHTPRYTVNPVEIGLEQCT